MLAAMTTDEAAANKPPPEGTGLQRLLWCAGQHKMLVEVIKLVIIDHFMQQDALRTTGKFPDSSSSFAQ